MKILLLLDGESGAASADWQGRVVGARIVAVRDISPAVSIGLDSGGALALTAREAEVVPSWTTGPLPEGSSGPEIEFLEVVPPGKSAGALLKWERLNLLHGLVGRDVISVRAGRSDFTLGLDGMRSMHFVPAKDAGTGVAQLYWWEGE